MFGIITIALGERRYIDMARMLALSLIQTNPLIQRAVITDTDKKEFDGYYDIYIPHSAELGKGLTNKIYLDKYSPFEETLFIDADCLVFKPLDKMLSICEKYPFVVFGDQINTGEWYMDVAAMCKKFDIPSVPLFNGGTYYLKKEAVTINIYNTARELYQSYAELGFHEFRGSINEEPIIAIAMAINGIDAVDDKGIGMRTPIGINGVLTLDVLKEKCLFDKEGEIVEPAIMHFAGSYADAFHYKREIAKLKMRHSLQFLNKNMVSALVNYVYNVPYSVFVFVKRVVKLILRRKKFDFAIALPIFSNQ